jgi:hypothetical protein
MRLGSGLPVERPSFPPYTEESWGTTLRLSMRARGHGASSPQAGEAPPGRLLVP